MKPIIKSKRLIERLVVECLMVERTQLLQWVSDNEYEIRMNGPKHLGEGKYDMDTFQATIEKIINVEKCH